MTHRNSSSVNSCVLEKILVNSYSMAHTINNPFLKTSQSPVRFQTASEKTKGLFLMSRKLLV